MKKYLYKEAVFHSGKTEEDSFSYMTVENGKITGCYSERPAGSFDEEISLGGKHVYPCLIDAHMHLLYTVGVMAIGFNICEITPEGIRPENLAGVEKRIREYAAEQPKKAVIALNNYIASGIEEKRLPNRFELDEWAGGRAVVVYSIDGHSSALSTEMMKKAGLDPNGSDGIMSGEAHERIMGTLTDIAASGLTLSRLAKGVALFQNACAAYGISTVCALEGNGDSEKDLTTTLITHLARHFDINVRSYYQYFDVSRAEKLSKYQKYPRIGGCGDWEMDGSNGSHSAAFSYPYKDTGIKSACYYTQEEVDKTVLEADRKGFQIASHAIGDEAIDMLVKALNKTESGRFHRVEHCEFTKPETFEELKKGRFAAVMQPGYAWIDKRYLHTYSSYLPDEIIKEMRFKSLIDAGICVCGSSDSPVQDMDPYMQMLGMTEFYIPEESVSIYEAFRCYTINAAKAILEENERGSLEPGKAADFFTSDKDLFSIKPQELISFRPCETYYAGKKYNKKKGTAAELTAMFFKAPKKI